MTQPERDHLDELMDHFFAQPGPLEAAASSVLTTDTAAPEQAFRADTIPTAPPEVLAKLYSEAQQRPRPHRSPAEQAALLTQRIAPGVGQASVSLAEVSLAAPTNTTHMGFLQRREQAAAAARDRERRQLAAMNTPTRFLPIARTLADVLGEAPTTQAPAVTATESATTDPSWNAFTPSAANATLGGQQRIPGATLASIESTSGKGVVDQLLEELKAAEAVGGTIEAEKDEVQAAKLTEAIGKKYVIIDGEEYEVVPGDPEDLEYLEFVAACLRKIPPEDKK